MQVRYENWVPIDHPSTDGVYCNTRVDRYTTSGLNILGTQHTLRSRISFVEKPESHGVNGTFFSDLKWYLDIQSHLSTLR